jgi:hypothetical protein
MGGMRGSVAKKEEDPTANAPVDILCLCGVFVYV